MTRSDRPILPSQVTDHVGLFDRFCGWVSDLSSRAPFFAFCVLLVILWVIQGAVKVAATGSFSTFLDSTYQLEINTTTTIITFLLVALLNNSSTRSDEATQHKLNAIAHAQAKLMEAHDADLGDEIAELERAVGIERYESTT